MTSRERAEHAMREIFDQSWQRGLDQADGQTTPHSRRDLIDQIDALHSHVGRMDVYAYVIESVLDQASAPGIVTEAVMLMREEIESAREVGQ